MDMAKTSRLKKSIKKSRFQAGFSLLEVMIVLGILGTGIGLTMVDPSEGTTPGAAGFGIGRGKV